MPDRTATCAECGESFTTNQPNKKYCGRLCRDKVRHRNYFVKHGSRLQVKVRDCIVCGVTFTADRAPSRQRRKYGDQYRRTCSRECGALARDRECVECGNPSGAKKRCDECRSRPTCPNVTATDCDWCGRIVVRWGAIPWRKYCSDRCAQYSHIRRPKVVEIDYRECRECGSTFSWYAGQEKDFCGTKCSRRAHKRDRRHLERTAGVGARGSITLREVAERDGWQCHLCHRPVPDRESKSRPNDPTIDHLIPLSDGGQHVPENVALAHFKCNWQRAATGPAQLRLIA